MKSLVDADGCPVVDFTAAEAIRRKPVGPKATEWAYRTGIVVVLMLMAVVTVNDLFTLPIFG